MSYFDSRSLFLNRGELSITSGEDLLRKRAVNFEHFAQFIFNKKVLDVGCCDGRWSSWMLDHGASFVHGVDVNPIYINSGALSIMPQYFPEEKYSFEVADILMYQPSVSFDVVALFGVLCFQDPMQMISKSCGIADTILVDSAVNTFVVGGGDIAESDVRNKFMELGFEIADIVPQEPFEGCIMFVATRKPA